MTVGARRAVRVAGSLAMLAVLVAILPGDVLWSALRQASAGTLAIALAIFLACHLAAALKWRMLMADAVVLSPMAAFRAHFTGLIGNLSPLGMIGGDIVRAGVAIKGSGRPASIMLTSIVDRLVDTAALVVLTTMGFLVVDRGTSISQSVLWAGAALVGAAAAGMLAGRRLLARTTHPRLVALRDAFDLLAARPGLIGAALLLSVSVQGTLIAANAYIGRAVGVDVSFGAWLIAWPAAKLIAYIPISVAGIGIRESALIVLLAPFGAAAAPVMAAGLLWNAVLIAGSVAGWLVLCGLPLARPSVLPSTGTS